MESQEPKINNVDLSPKSSEVEKRIVRLERLARDVGIAAIIIGICITAFLGYQSYIGIPKVVSTAMEGTAIAKTHERAKSLLAEITQTTKDVQEAAAEARSTIQSAKSSVPTGVKQKVEDIDKRLNHLDELAHGHPLFIKNKCDQPIKLVISYTSTYLDQITGGWWNFASKTSGYLTDSNNRRIILTKRSFYLYAETTEGPSKKWYGDHAVQFENKTLGMTQIKADEDSDQYRASLNCEDK